jgi:sugar/nucleoside kinase (ribokinase family)
MSNSNCGTLYSLDGYSFDLFVHVPRPSSSDTRRIHDLVRAYALQPGDKFTAEPKIYEEFFKASRDWIYARAVGGSTPCTLKNAASLLKGAVNVVFCSAFPDTPEGESIKVDIQSYGINVHEIKKTGTAGKKFSVPEHLIMTFENENGTVDDRIIVKQGSSVFCETISPQAVPIDLIAQSTDVFLQCSLKQRCGTEVFYRVLDNCNPEGGLHLALATDKKFAASHHALFRRLAFNRATNVFCNRGELESNFGVPLQRGLDMLYGAITAKPFSAGTRVRSATITVGEVGAYLVSRKGINLIPAKKLGNVLSTDGAGDAFAGGRLAGIAAGLSSKHSAVLGTWLGAITVVKTPMAMLPDPGEELAKWANGDKPYKHFRNRTFRRMFAGPYAALVPIA